MNNSYWIAAAEARGVRRLNRLLNRPTVPSAIKVEAKPPSRLNAHSSHDLKKYISIDGDDRVVQWYCMNCFNSAIDNGSCNTLHYCCKDFPFKLGSKATFDFRLSNGTLVRC